ncbi:unnamed protein product [Polarella glacialis]|uniref:Uncharacterized protein n=1 Tax=Polarella glacialis TaxID=89957 RepID=A0A813H5F2_POLGL|nr:unnamed protein product [Polarella glacialis]
MTTRAELDARYGVALEALQVAAKAKAPDLEECALELQRLKIKLRESKRRLMERVEKPEWNSYPAPMDLPRSAEDERFVQSFGVDDAAAATAFYDKYGFVIFDDILDAEECAATTAEIWSYLEEQHPGLQRDDEGTWEVLSAVRYGLPEAQAIFTPQVVANRQNQRLYAALDAILPRMPDSPGEFDSPHPDPNSIVMSQDRWCVYRPTIKNPDWKTAENLHLDVNPWTYAGLNPSEIETLSYSATESGGERFPLRDFRIEMTAVQGAPRSTGEHVQGVLNLLDNREQDGGTRLVPGFHRCFADWVNALGSPEDNLLQDGPYDNWLLRRSHGGASFKFSSQDPIHDLSRRAPLRAGSLLLWNQLVVHGSRANNSEAFRLGQFVRGFRAGEMTSDRAWARMRAVRHQLGSAGLQLSSLAPHVFGVPENYLDEDADPRFRHERGGQVQCQVALTPESLDP